MDMAFDLGARALPWQQFAMVAGAHGLALLSPGPDFFLVVRSALVHGLRRASGVCLGIALGNGVFIGLALAGFAAMRDYPLLFAALQWAGCAYLAWLGWRLLRASGELAIPAADGAAPAPWLTQLASGFLSAVLNPKNGLFYASLFSVLAASRTPPAVQLAYGAWMFAVVLGWDLLVAYGIGHPAVRTLFLSHSDPKQAVAQIKQLFRPKEILVDDRLNGVVARDSVETLQAIERLIQALDLPQSEVTLDVQVLEVARNDLLNLGIGYPGKITGSLSEAINPGGLGVPASALRNINAGNILLDAGSPQVTLNLLQRSGNTQTLANPKIRVRNREKATISIGERVPVVTTTNANGVVTESVQYQDVGLKLDVEPNISLSNEISIRLAMDVSNIISETVTRTGLITYVLGTRSAKTTLTARNNETQVLAGLIRRADIKAGEGLPGLSRVPVLDRIFGTRQDKQEQTEIVLLITPHIERSLDLPAF
ncbi:LysE family transporter [Cupriavidus sp. SK-4]|uniref:LysE family transporter n=1 Tax=Cupriavidus sp. SK-4 TaxID=574750 RepID=UPI000A46DCEA|nr:LysE family transporter [Cupriavidus sp. SK-4]